MILSFKKCILILALALFLNNTSFASNQVQEVEDGKVKVKMETPLVEASMEDIKELQTAIHSHIKRVGGYWRPLSALARVMEEYGEFCQALTTIPQNKEEISSELADLFLIVTCLANQYSCHLEKSYHKLGMPRELVYSSLRDKMTEKAGPETIAVQIGELARIINCYEGDKPPKMGEELSTVEEQVGKVHQAILSYAVPNDINLIPYVLSRIILSGKRDKKRFKQVYDPAMCESLEHFNKIQDNVECIFAKQAKIWGSPEWDENEDVNGNTINIVPVLTRFIKISALEKLDGFVIAAPGKYGSSIPLLSQFLKNVLTTLSKKDPAQEDAMAKDISTSEWQFSFGGQRLFIITFAPCYPKENSRYAWGMEKTFVFLQPEHSFTSSYHIPRGEGEGKRLAVRKRFEAKDRGYNRPDIMCSDSEAVRYIKPLTLDDPIVEWWKTPLEGDNTSK